MEDWGSNLMLPVRWIFFRRDAELLPEGAVIFFLNADGGETGEEGSEERGEFEETFRGAGRDAGVGEDDGDVAFFGETQEVRPDFALDENDA